MKTFINEYLYIQHEPGSGFSLSMGPKEGVPEEEVFIDYQAAKKLTTYFKEQSKQAEDELLTVICGDTKSHG